MLAVNLGVSSSSSGSTQSPDVGTATQAAQQTRCLSARKALNYYRLRWASWRELRGVETAVRLRQPHGCAHTRWAASKWAERARESRSAYAEWREARWVVREQRDWERAVQYVQRWFPGTGAWLWSCSGAEGGHGRWVTYGGGTDVQYALRNYVVGGWMQFKWPTFNGMYRLAVEHLRARGYRLHQLPAPGEVRAWLSPTAQALAAGWARYTGEDDSHWSASFGNGC